MSNKKLVHGGDWAGFEAEYGYAPIDFSANVSPLGVPDGVRQAMIQAIDEMDRYPDPLCRQLTDVLAAVEEVAPQHVICGNGAADLVFRLTTAVQPKKALITAPAFAEYEEALLAAGCQVMRYPLSKENDFRLDPGFSEAITEDTDMVFLCQPNNPTGVTDGRKMLLQVLRRCEETGAFLLMDECFNDFLDEPDKHTMKGYTKSSRNLVILRSFTKMYAMAGVRLGYCICSHEGMMWKMRRAVQPWQVSHMAQKAGVAALQEKEYVKGVRSIVKKERLRLLEELRRMGLHVVPGEANYLLFYSIPGLDEALREKGFLIRNCRNYHGLEEGWYRIAVRTEKENTMLMDAVRHVLQGQERTDNE